MNYLKCLLTIMLVVLTGCAKEEIDDLVLQNETENEANLFNTQAKFGKRPVRSENELIIEYKKDVNADLKKRLRARYGVTRYKTCNCTNTRIELWQFKDGIDIEGRKDEVTEEGVGVEGADFQFYYSAKNNAPELNASNQNYNLIKSFVSTNEAKVTIAVLDTGIALNNLPDETPFLYNSSANSGSCKENEEEISGWDFVNNDNDVFDDNGHGTIVTSIIRSKLNKEGIDDYQILPVKVFDHLGRGSTFTILCGYLYATDKKDVSIINFSFGWYGAPNELFRKLISENHHIIHIASAGNNTYDNDNIIGHYPSSYNLNNILTIGSSNIKVNNIANFSNYGTTSVDFLSLGENILFEDRYGNSYYVSGTSFAAPFVTALYAKHYLNGYSSQSQITNQLHKNAKLIGTRTSLPVKYSDRIIN